ncbi:MAG TPA: methylmalonyl Co-A mutase-associated GTPase MeaB [Candidatus Obscuribacterales bacterium]
MDRHSLKFTLESISKDILSGDRRSLARALSIVEDGGPEASWLVRKLFPHSGRAHLIGVTGSPGVGKSTLVDALIVEILKAKLRVGVLCIDPTSPFTGGAILGDRIRMQGHTLDKNVFIRSMANRGHAGGTALATYDAVRMLEAAGFDVIIIETVGVGQSELAIAQTADTTVLVLMPGSGDDIQAIKSGIMEIGDVFVVNKGDLPGAQKTATEVMQSLELSKNESGWHAPVDVTNAETNEGVEKVWTDIQKHRQWLEKTGNLKARRRAKSEAELAELVAEIARTNLHQSLEHSKQVQDLVSELVDHKVDPHSAAERVIQTIFTS